MVSSLGSRPGSQGPLLPRELLCGPGDLVGMKEMPREGVSDGEAFLPPFPVLTEGGVQLDAGICTGRHHSALPGTLAKSQHCQRMVLLNRPWFELQFSQLPLSWAGDLGLQASQEDTLLALPLPGTPPAIDRAATRVTPARCSAARTADVRPPPEAALLPVALRGRGHGPRLRAGGGPVSLFSGA